MKTNIGIVTVIWILCADLMLASGQTNNSTVSSPKSTVLTHKSRPSTKAAAATTTTTTTTTTATTAAATTTAATTTATTTKSSPKTNLTTSSQPATTTTTKGTKNPNTKPKNSTTKPTTRSKMTTKPKITNISSSPYSTNSKPNKVTSTPSRSQTVSSQKTASPSKNQPGTSSTTSSQTKFTCYNSNCTGEGCLSHITRDNGTCSDAAACKLTEDKTTATVLYRMECSKTVCDWMMLSNKVKENCCKKNYCNVNTDVLKSKSTRMSSSTLHCLLSFTAIFMALI